MRVCVRAVAVATFAAVFVSARPVLALSGAERAEVARVRQHISGAETIMARRDVFLLSSAQRVARARNLRLLRAYRAAGLFPRNEHFPGRRVPVFRDDHGTLCAMAYLIAKSGRTDLVNRVAQTHNYARIPELAQDPALVAWLRDAGMSASEAARVQPSYSYFPPTTPPDGPSPSQQSEWEGNRLLSRGIVAAVGSGAAIYATTRPIRSRSLSTSAAVFSLAMGAYSLKLSGDAFRSDNADYKGFVGLTSGVLSGVDLYLGVRTLMRLNKKPTVKTSGAAANGTSTAFVHDAELHIHPVVLPRGGGLVFSRHF